MTLVVCAFLATVALYVWIGLALTDDECGRDDARGAHGGDGRSGCRPGLRKEYAMKGSWRTTMAGILAFLAVLAADLQDLWDMDPATVFEVGKVLATAVVLWGLWQARDNRVTSEAAGARRGWASSGMRLPLLLFALLLLTGCVSAEAKATAHALARDLPVLAANVAPAPLTTLERERGKTQAAKNAHVRELLELVQANARRLEENLR